MFRPALSVPSLICRRFIVANKLTSIQTLSTVAKSKPEKIPHIKVALCIQRYPALSPEMTKLEKDYSDLITELEKESSYLSDHELRQIAETEHTRQRQKSTTNLASSANVVETVVDLEDRLAKEFQNFQFMPRQTDDDKTNNVRSQNRKLDQHLLLIVQKVNPQTNIDEWIFPEKQYDGEPTLREVAEQIIPACGNLHVHIAGNAPLACYKNDNEPLSKKTFFYKAEYLSGIVKQFSTLKSSAYKDHAWITHEDLPKYLSPSYYKAVKDMLFVF